MTYMQVSDDLGSSCIQELSFDEVEAVAGGPAVAVTVALIGGAVALFGAAAAAISHLRSDDCTTTNIYNSEGQLTKSSTVCT